jgi:nitroimidazol reductase NimA-like FMN-containing flavoprotein (pyridoxamine 5'-phosphate oxidase superfamily)
MKTYAAEKGIGMSEAEARKFLTQSRSTLLLGTTNADGTPMIHPVWYYFDSTRTRLYFYTEPALKKTTNVKERSEVYFDVDSDKWPYMGVKGRGKARILPDKREALSFCGKILAKYIKKGHPWARSVLEKIKGGGYIVIEITPAYFTTWDYAKVGLPDAVIS